MKRRKGHRQRAPLRDRQERHALEAELVEQRLQVPEPRLERDVLDIPIGEAGAALEHTRLILPVDTESPFPWTGIFFGLGLILGPAYWIGNQAIVQRTFGVRSEADARASYVFAGAFAALLTALIQANPSLLGAFQAAGIGAGYGFFVGWIIGIATLGGWRGRR